MIRFRGPNDRPARQPRRPPPDYFSRRMQVRILVYVFLFMLVLTLMFEAHKASNWEWMWHLNAAPSASAGSDGFSTASADAVPPSRPPPQTAEERADGPVVTPATRPQSVLSSGTSARLSLDGWTFALRRLSAAQQDLFQSGMRNWRRGESQSSLARQLWQQLVERLDTIWGDYHTRAQQVIDDSRELWTAQQLREATQVLASSRVTWQSRRRRLTALVPGEALTPAQAAALRQLQSTLDERAWAQVEDNAVYRSAESEAWQRCWEQLAELSPAQRQAAVATVNYVQLFSQTEQLRGQLIKLRGSVRRAYRTKSAAANSPVGSYVVMGVLLHKDQTAPVVVYCADLPPGFPQVGPADDLGQGQPMHVEVEITGILFKRWLHRSLGGMQFSPLVLGEVDQWRAPPEAAPARPLIAINTPVILLTLLLLTLCATKIALVVYRSTRWSSGSHAAGARKPSELPAFADESTRGSVAESLQALQASQEDKTS